VALALLLAVTMAGCSAGGPRTAATAQGHSSAAGTPAAASPAGGPPAAASPAAARPAAATPAARNANAGRSLSAVDPCSLGSQLTAEIDLVKVKAGALPGTRACNWEAAKLDADLTGSSYAVSVYIYDHAGLPAATAPQSGDTVTHYPSLEGHQARLVKNAGTGKCTVALSVTASSRADVSVYGSSLAADCAAATAAAPAVAGQLPAVAGQLPGGQPGSAGSGAAGPASAPRGPLAAVAPCSMGARVTAGLTVVKSGPGYCQWVYGTTKSIKTAQIEAVEVDFVYGAGLRGIVPSPDVTMAPYPAVDGHRASTETVPSLNSCFISVGVTASSRVDVGVDDYLGSYAGACALARKFAPMLARQLPAAG
jgi:hypothetical protein